MQRRSLLTEVTGCMQEVQEQKKGRAGQIEAQKAQVAATAEVQVQPLLHRMLCAGWVESLLSFDHNDTRTTTGHHPSGSICTYMLPGSC